MSVEDHSKESSEDLPFYEAVGAECQVFNHCHAQSLPLLLKGPTGCGKSRLVEHMAARMGRPLVTVSAHEETSAVDLLGRYLVRGGETHWLDGPVTRAVREGAILYVDEVAEARPDVVVVLHPLTDHRRRLFIDRLDEELIAAPGFMLVVSYNPGYQGAFKQLKPSTRQRFVGMSMTYPEPALEQRILIGETGCDEGVAKRLVALGQKLRGLDQLGLSEVPSTRLLVDTARLIGSGLPPRLACRVGILQLLSDDTQLVDGLGDLVDLVF